MIWGKMDKGLVRRASAVATDTRAVGSTVALDALWGGPISGASMNPARSFGPALIAGVWVNQWIYWIAPIIGASIGAVVYQLLRGETET